MTGPATNRATGSATGRAPASNAVAIVGYAQSPVRRHHDKPLGALTVDTARAAIADAGLTVADVDGFVGSALFPAGGDHAVVDGISSVTPHWLARALGARPSHVAGFQGMGQIPGSLAMAVNAVASGAATHVLVHRALHNPPGRYHGTALTHAAGDLQWTVPQGFFGPLATIALTYQEYLLRYNAKREAMAAVVVELRRNGSRIPWSYWHDRPLTEQEYLAAPLLDDPMCRLDADIPVDGAAAFVLTSAERARDLPHAPVYVSGYATSVPLRSRLPMHWPLDDIEEAADDLVGRLWRHAGISPADVDLPQVYDGFSPLVYLWLEALGYCPRGEAHRLATDGGLRADDPAAVPALSGGGALGNGRMHGVPQLLECYLQLAGRAGDRARPATVAVACHSAPHMGGAVALSATRF